ncbi:iron-containing alcohol dehydrogenase [Veillonella sp. CHU740]|uniref:iron-containing alcohol dehydrogenase n=1 Tax=Veillonella sp. CHU740 TaxID=2490950 RepID=UPI000F8E74DA|nr:iron-containing alcohol dehydrogenase [Veillonella sp. CHU740]
MKPFIYHNPTKIVFGKDCVVESLTSELEQYGKRVLVTYGGGSIKKNGVYDTVINVLQEAGKEVFELSGIMSNPRTTKVREGIALCKEHQIDFILAVGGGSVIDCTKFIAGGAKLPDGVDFWQTFFLEHQPVTEAIPFGVVLTMAATGSEMNNGGVITDWETQKKLSGYGPAIFPQFSMLDPTYTYTLPREQVAYGIVDMLSHLMEQYMSTPDDDNVTDSAIEGVFKNIVRNGRKSMENLEDYEARSNIMWGATLALNRSLGLGKDQDWMTHALEHALSAFYDIPHGAGLAIMHPAYLRWILPKATDRLMRFAREVWGIERGTMTEEEYALAGIETLEAYFREIGAPSTLQEVGIPKESLGSIAKSCVRYPTAYSNLSVEDAQRIYESVFEK